MPTTCTSPRRPAASRAVTARNASWRSTVAEAPAVPWISITLPWPPSVLPMKCAAASPISLLSAPMCRVTSVLTLRSIVTTGVPASITCLTTGVRASAVTGLISRMSMPRAIRLSTSATCLAALSSPLVMISSTSGMFFSAYSRLPSTILTRHELCSVPCEKPIVILSWASGADGVPASNAAAPRTARQVVPKALFMTCSLDVWALARGAARSRGAAAPAPLHLEQDGGDDDRAFDDLLGERRYAGEIEDVGQDREDGGADHRAEHAAFAAEQAGAADHGDRDGFELEPHAGRRLAHGEPRTEDKAGERRQEAADHIDQQDGEAHVDAGQPCRLAVAAHGVDIAAERGEPQDDEGHAGDQREDPDRDGQSQEIALAKPGEGGRRIVEADRVAFGDSHRQAPPHDHHAERHDEGGTPPSVTPRPLTPPIATPMQRPATMTRRIAIPALSMRAAATAVTATIEPTARSMPAVMMTKVMPMLTMPNSATWRRTLIRLNGLRKAGEMITATAHSSRSAQSSPEVRGILSRRWLVGSAMRSSSSASPRTAMVPHPRCRPNSGTIALSLRPPTRPPLRPWPTASAAPPWRRRPRPGRRCARRA